jgi:simple sugar transport system ATP-binding protein
VDRGTIKSALAAVGIGKRYGQVVANESVTLDVRYGEIHAVLGENGAGKSTLMRIFYGMEQPDAGHVERDGAALSMQSPRGAIQAGIGMVHQHFMLVPDLTILENLVLGTPLGGRFRFSRSKARMHLTALAARYRIFVDFDSPINKLTVGEQQRVELLKTLVRSAKVLILDEPTAVLTPQEISDLGATLRELSAEGHAIIIVTHKLAEVMMLSQRVSVMRQGHLVGTWNTNDTTAEALVGQMIGRTTRPIIAREAPELPVLLEIQNLQTNGERGRGALRGIDLRINAGEILGLAGVEGNGQRDLANAITGLCRVDVGQILLDGTPITNWPTSRRLRAGISVIPENRHRDGVILAFSVADNAILLSFDRAPINRHGVLQENAMTAFTDSLIRLFSIRCSGPGAPLRSLSGGNQQKLVLARELARVPRLLIAMQPTRGMDIGAINDVHEMLLRQRGDGMAILLISTELEEVLALSDRIVVMRDGVISGALSRDEASPERVGALMLHSHEPEHVRA